MKRHETGVLKDNPRGDVDLIDSGTVVGPDYVSGRNSVANGRNGGLEICGRTIERRFDPPPRVSTRNSAVDLLG